MKQLITEPTRVTPTSETLIDVIMTCNSALVTDSGVFETHISDHYLVYAVLNFKAPKPLPTYVISRSYKNYDSESFVNDLAQVPLYENALIDDTGEKVEHFNGKFLCANLNFEDDVINLSFDFHTVKIILTTRLFFSNSNPK